MEDQDLKDPKAWAKVAAEEVMSDAVMEFNRTMSQFQKTNNIPVPFRAKFIRAARHTSPKAVIDIDEKFFADWVTLKLDFAEWLYEREPDVARDYYRRKAMNQDESVKVKRLKKEWMYENGITSMPEIKNRSKNRKLIATIENRKQAISLTEEDKQLSGRERAFKRISKYKITTASTKDVMRFIEDGEMLLFGGKTSLFSPKSANISTYLSGQSLDDQGAIGALLKEALTEFNKRINIVKQALVDQGGYEYFGTKRDVTSSLGKEGLDIWKHRKNRPEFKFRGRVPTKQRKVGKFPNLDAIEDWYLEKGRFKSSNYVKNYAQLRTNKERTNFIDRAIFLIANGVYMKRGGKDKRISIKEAKARRGKRNPNFTKESDRKKHLSGRVRAFKRTDPTAKVLSGDDDAAKARYRALSKRRRRYRPSR